MVYLEKHQDPNSKPMKQVLDTLGKFRKHWSQDCSWDRTRRDTAFKCLKFVLSQDELPFIKPAMHLLYYFLSSGDFETSHLTECLKDPAFSPCHAPALDDGPWKTPEWKDTRDLMANVFRWGQYLDIAPVAGQLLVAILNRCKLSSSTNCPENHPPVWNDLVFEFLHCNSRSLETLEKYILPGLLRFDEATAAKFLESLSLDKILDGQICADSDCVSLP